MKEIERLQEPWPKLIQSISLHNICLISSPIQY